jgi:phosphate transport system substrate-binding protein
LKLNRFGGLVGVVAAGALVVSGCGSDNNASGGGATTGASSAQVTCGGKKTLKASGSTAQANAMTRFVKAFEQACPDQTLNYTPNGSGAGIREFNGNQTDVGGSDSPLSQDESAAAQQRCGGSPAWNLPTVFGPIAVTFNINTVTSLTLGPRWRRSSTAASPRGTILRSRRKIPA